MLTRNTAMFRLLTCSICRVIPYLTPLGHVIITDMSYIIPVVLRTFLAPTALDILKAYLIFDVLVSTVISLVLKVYGVPQFHFIPQPAVMYTYAASQQHIIVRQNYIIHEYSGMYS